MGTVEKYILKRIKDERTVHFILIDPESSTPNMAANLSKEAEKAGSAAILVGGSTVTHPNKLDLIVKAIKRNVKVPVILFPGNVTGISKHADAVLFMSLLNSSNPYFIVGAQTLGAPLIKKYGLEPISLGYIILGQGGVAGLVGYAHPMPYDRPELAAMYALAAQYLGMHFVYLEAGSGASEPIPPNVISQVNKTIDIPLIVGGGIKKGTDAKKVADAGASIIVTGNIIEETAKVKNKITEIINKIKS
ncbi:MAG: geranylgeranylglyceryl/heptaprenylglyceryl phosphate synthase [Candidatus Bathyarchaeota archaeon]